MYKFALIIPLIFLANVAAGDLHIDLMSCKAKTAQSECDEAEAYLLSGNFSSHELNNINFFTTYSFPEKYMFEDGVVIEPRKLAEQALNFIVNSTMNYTAPGGIERIKRVKGSTTLFWFDASDYGHTESDMANISKIQPYFLSPLVTSRINSRMFRADWFIVNAMDATKQTDRKIKDIAYFTLLYGLNYAPKDATEFRKLWNVNTKFARSGTIIDQGDSGVSRHTRGLRRLGIEGGYYWDTKDIKSHEIDTDTVKRRDFLEDAFLRYADAMEYIVSHPTTHLQVYHLTLGNNDKFKTITEADTAVVIHKGDKNDPRVRTAIACLNCHAGGIIPYTSAVRDLFKTGAEIITDNKDFYRRLKSFYTTYSGEEVEADNKLFAAAVKKATDADPFEVSRNIGLLYRWYWEEKVGLTQASLELGCSEDSIKVALNDSTTARLVLLQKGKGMPREIWDSTLDGGYIQTSLLLKTDITAIKDYVYLTYEQGLSEARRTGKKLMVGKSITKRVAYVEYLKCVSKGYIFCMAKSTANIPDGVHEISTD